MVYTGLHDTYRITWCTQDYMVPTGLHDTYRITWYIQDYMVHAGLHDAYRITWYIQDGICMIHTGLTVDENGENQVQVVLEEQFSGYVMGS